MKIALVHDYLYTYGGAERVLEALHEIWPSAPIYTAWVHWPWLKKEKPEWQSWKIVPSWFDKIPGKKQLCSPLRFLAPKIWSSFNLSQYDLVICSSAWYMNKGVSLNKLKVKSEKLPARNALPETAVSLQAGSQSVAGGRITDKKSHLTIKPSNHSTIYICYCHTPPRYLYGYETSFNFQKYWWARLYANLINPFMRYYDFRSSQTIDYFICNSREVQQRIEKFYRRKAKVVYPGVARVSRVSRVPRDGCVSRVPQGYYLMVNRLVGPKNIDLGIRACRRLKINLKIVGTGPDEKRLKKIAGNDPKIEFLGYVDDDQLTSLYVNCKAVLYLAEQEDFGITPIEAMSFGKPVVALRSGGVVESVIEGKTGLFIDKKSLAELVKWLDGLMVKWLKKFKPTDCFQQAAKFSQARFKKEIKKFVSQIGPLAHAT